MHRLLQLGEFAREVDAEPPLHGLLNVGGIHLTLDMRPGDAAQVHLERSTVMSIVIASMVTWSVQPWSVQWRSGSRPQTHLDVGAVLRLVLVSYSKLSQSEKAWRCD